MNAMRPIDRNEAASCGLVPEPETNAQLQLPPVFSSAKLFDGRTEILIAHAGAHYRLKITRQGKLILTK